MATYVANGLAGAAAWNLLAVAHPPGVGGGQIVHPAANAATYFYFAMDGYASVDLGDPYTGLFTSSLCGCVAGFLVRTNAGQVRRISGYHKTNIDNIPAGALALFNTPGGPGGPAHGDVNYLILPDKGSYAAGPRGAIEAVVGPARLILTANVHNYIRNGDPHVSWVISFNGDMGEMSGPFDQSRSPEQSKHSGVQAAIAIPPPPGGQRRCMPCVIL